MTMSDYFNICFRRLHIYIVYEYPKVIDLYWILFYQREPADLEFQPVKLEFHDHIYMVLKTLN